MKQRGFLLLLVGALLFALQITNAPVAYSQAPQDQLKAAIIDVDSPGQLKKLEKMGLDIVAVRQGPEKVGPDGLSAPTFRVEAVISSSEGQKLGKNKFSWQEVPGKGPTHKTGSPYDVYHSFDEPVSGIRAELRTLNATYPKLTELRSIGRTLEGRSIPAMRITNERVKGDKPQVLYHATTHAREWVSTEVAMRLIEYLASNHGTDPRITNLVDNTEIWIVPVVNPDGYQYTFTTERLWRKNLRDNDSDGQITLVDGIDLNRNFDGHWGYDDEGSSPDPSSATYRGPAPESEPETQALTNFIRENDFKFALSYHTYGDLILYPWGWQVSTPSNDDPIFVAQAGVDGNAAVFDSLLGADYDPGVGADLYTTNGEFTDWAYGAEDIPSYTIELTYGYYDIDQSPDQYFGFEFPDDEAMVQGVFEDNLEFALSLAESAQDPAHPVSPVGFTTEDVYHTPVTDSYGSDQIIEIIARKDLTLNLSYRINNGDPQDVDFSEKLGDIYNEETGVYYSRYQAVISGQQQGNTISYEVSGGSSVISGNYSVTSATGHPILLVAAEDYGAANTRPPYSDNTQPNFLQYYIDALNAGNYEYDVWNVNDQGIPSNLEVLSHYQVVIWYTGNDFVARIPNGLGTQEAEVLNFRDFINYNDGKIFATGQDLTWLAGVAHFYSDDFFQYYLGAYIDVDTGGMTADGLPFIVIDEPGDPLFDGTSFSLQGGADNQVAASSYAVTSFFLPDFTTDSAISARYDRPSPFKPHSGDYFVYSQQADDTYKRLGGTFTVPTDNPTLKFWTSYDIEGNWDYAFVEVSVAGSGIWTTLPDETGFTTTETGDSCASGWVEQLHPFLANYMDADCNPTGATGSWNAFTGTSGGWQQIEINLADYAGQTVELYISYVSDWGTQNLGVFVDDIELGNNPVQDFESGLGDWSIVAGPSGEPLNNWVRVTGDGFPEEGPVIRTRFSVLSGFGFEAIDTEENRNTVMQDVMEYLGQ